ncbi:hypothetical protein [Elizabethkingia anophelis]|nr:hypothetical protein [Elizabethkingia anophelis]MCL1692036.1 hypothetical protein [Elizabethkingia anophelis]
MEKSNETFLFLKQTAKDYDMKLSQVEHIYNLYPDDFYNQLEKFIKERSN